MIAHGTTNIVNRAYSKLCNIFEQYYLLRRNLSILNWDSAVAMPKNSINIRSKQLSAQNSAIDSLINNTKIKKYINIVYKQIDCLDKDKQANFREIKKVYDLHESIPIRLQNRISEQSAKTEVLWREAREKNNFKIVSKELDRVINLTIEKSKILSDVFETDQYASLMQEYDYGVTDQEVSKLFKKLQKELPDLIYKIIKPINNVASKSQTHVVLNNAFQKNLCINILKDFGFDFDNGRLDKSAHPFTEGGMFDVRVTTSYHKDRPFESLLAAVHELGHALYDMHLPKDLFSQPIGYDMGMMFHEATALFYEMCIFRTTYSAKYTHNKIKTLGFKQEFCLDNITESLINNSPSLIRIESGEAEYLLHIILRYNIEKMLLRHEITAKDLPEVWNALSEKLLNNIPETNQNGCLQDVHWYSGLFGYFPSYGLGSILAANIFTNNNINNILNNINLSDQSKISKINNIMIDKMFSKGRTLHRNYLIKNLTGENHLSADKYIQYLKTKYDKK